MTLEKPKRPLSMGDIQRGSEFTIAQTLTLDRSNGPSITVRVGDIIKIEKCDEQGFNISINGRLAGKNAPRVLLADAGDFIIEDEE